MFNERAELASEFLVRLLCYLSGIISFLSDYTNLFFKVQQITQKFQTKICVVKIRKTYEWPEEWTTSIIVPFRKKGATTDYNNFHLIALLTP